MIKIYELSQRYNLCCAIMLINEKSFSKKHIFAKINIDSIMSDLEFAVIVFTSFITLINPLGVIPVFLSMTSTLQPSRRNKVAFKAVLVAFITLMIFVITGQLIFKLFSISVDSLRIVGGVIFFKMGYDMLQAQISRVKMDSPEEIRQYSSDIAVTPLGIPMICGPGAITNAIVLWQDAHTVSFKIILIAGILIILAITYFSLSSAAKIIGYLGETGNKVLMRIMGLIVMVIAVEFFFSGLGPMIAKMMANL